MSQTTSHSGAFQIPGIIRNLLSCVANKQQILCCRRHCMVEKKIVYIISSHNKTFYFLSFLNISLCTINN